MRVAWLVLVVVACGGAQHAEVATPPKIEVFDPGAEPRAVVRYTVADAAQRFEYAIDGSIALDGQQVEFPVTTSIVRVAATADGRVQILLEEHATMKGARITWRVGPNGEISDRRYEGVPAQQREAMNRLVSVTGLGTQFPDVPIGVGAKWRVRSQMTDGNGIRWNLDQRHALVDRTETTATITSQIETTAGEQSVGSNVTLVSARGNGTGTGTILLNGIGTTGTFAFHAALVVRVDGRGTSKSLFTTNATVRPLD